MRDAALMVSNGGVVPGREKEAMALFQRSQSFWEKQETDGKVKRVGPFFIAPGSGAAEDVTYFALYLGRLDTLQAILASEEYEKLVYVGYQVVKNSKIRLFLGGTEREVMRVVGGAMTEWQVAGLMKE